MQNAHVLPPTAAIYALRNFPQLPTNLAVGLSFATDSFPICPCSKKQPLVAGGWRAATTDPATIHGWFSRWPDALAAIATGPVSRLFVLDVDGPAGSASLNNLLVELGVDTIADLTPVVSRTPRGGLHLYFRMKPNETPRSRASDIAPGLDTRGIGGLIIAPGNVLFDGKCYKLLDASDLETDSRFSLQDAPYAPRELIYLATFNKRERELIESTPALREALLDAQTHEFASVLQHWRGDEAARMRERMGPCEDTGGYRAQAVHDLISAARAYARLADGRRTGLFIAACRVAKYAAHDYLTSSEIVAAFTDAARTNGALQKHGLRWAENTIRSAIERARNDDLPPLAREFRKIGGQ